MRIAGILTSLAMTLGAAVQAETIAIQVQSAVVRHDEQLGQDLVHVRLTPNGQQSLSSFTRDRVGRTIHLRVGGVLLTSATIRSPIEGRSLQLSPGATGFNGISALDIAKRLNASGAMDVSDE